MIRTRQYEHRLPSGLLRRRSFLAVNAVVFLFVAVSFAREYVHNRDMRAEINRLESEASAMDQKNFDLARLGQKFSTDAMLEREARLNLGLQRPGESVIILRDASTPSANVRIENAPAIAAETPRPGPWDNARKWWRHFFPDVSESEQVNENNNSNNQQAL
jgi:cell division protein FtsB